MNQNERQIPVTHLSTSHHFISYNVILYCCTKYTDEVLPADRINVMPSSSVTTCPSFGTTRYLEDGGWRFLRIAGLSTYGVTLKKTAAIFVFTAAQTSDRTILNFTNPRQSELHYEV